MGITEGDEVLWVSGLGGGQWAVVEQQAVGRLGDELQRDLALEAGPDGREPGVAMAVETVLGLLALGPVEHGGALTPVTTAEEGNMATHLHL